MSRVVVNPAIEEIIEDEASLALQLHEVASIIAANARLLAPIETGDYKRSIHVEKIKGDVAVVADDWKSNWMEFGTANGTPTYAPLRKGAELAGFRVHAR